MGDPNKAYKRQLNCQQLMLVLETLINPDNISGISEVHFLLSKTELNDNQNTPSALLNGFTLGFHDGDSQFHTIVHGDFRESNSCDNWGWIALFDNYPDIPSYQHLKFIIDNISPDYAINVSDFEIADSAAKLCPSAPLREGYKAIQEGDFIEFLLHVPRYHTWYSDMFKNRAEWVGVMVALLFDELFERNRIEMKTEHPCNQHKGKLNAYGPHHIHTMLEQFALESYCGLTEDAQTVPKGREVYHALALLYDWLSKEE